MILFINGAFGVGKTSVANVLVKRIPDAILYDPEEVGFMLRNVLEPIEKVDDFQNYALWRTLTVEVARQLKEEYGRPLVTSMTIWRHDYFDEIIGGLRSVDPDLLCFRLTTSEEVLKRRILSRPDEEGPHDWCLEHLDVCLEASRNPAFGIEIDTDSRTPEEIADEILQIADGLNC